MTITTMLAIMNKISVITLLSILALFPLSNSFAAWQELGSNERMVVYVDLDTISDVGEKARIMSMLDFKQPGIR